MPREEAMESIRQWAADGAQVLTDFGALADFSEASVVDLDRLLAARVRLGEEQVFNLGCYFGEVVCRTLRAEWSPLGRPPDGDRDVLEVTLPRGSQFWPVQQVTKRVDAAVDDHVGLASFINALRAIDSGRSTTEPPE